MNESLSRRIAEARENAVRFMAILGQRELAEDRVTVRDAGGASWSCPSHEAVARPASEKGW